VAWRRVAQGFLNERGKPYAAKSVARCCARGLTNGPIQTPGDRQKEGGGVASTLPWGKQAPSRRGVVACPRQEAWSAPSGALGRAGVELGENGSVIPRPPGRDHFPAKGPLSQLAIALHDAGRVCSGGRTHRGACYILGF
jgi:hypothetical protein